METKVRPIGNCIEFLKKIAPDRAVYILYDKGHSYEEFTYWNRRMFIKSINPNGGITDYEFPSTSGSWRGHSIFSCGTNLQRLLNLYNSKETSKVEKEFIKHFIFDFLTDKEDTRHDRFHAGLFYHLKFFYTRRNNATNCSLYVTQDLFQIFYYMKRLGFKHDHIMESLKEKAKEDGWVGGIHSNCQEMDGDWEESVTKFWKMKTFKKVTDYDKFCDVFIEWVVKKYHIGSSALASQSGVRELGDTYVKVIDEETMESEVWGKFKVKPGALNKMVKELVLPYTTTTWSTVKSVHKGAPYGRGRDVSVPRTHHHAAKIKTKDVDITKLKEGTKVVQCRIEDGQYRIWGQPFEWGASDVEKYTKQDESYCIKLIA